MATLESVPIEYMFAMFKGEPGTRKSTQALSFPGPQYWFSSDKKMRALKLPAQQWGIDTKNIHYDNYSDWDSMEAKFKQFQLNCPFQTIIVDSVTSTGDNMNLQVKRFKTANKEGGGKSIGGIKTNSIEDYNAEASAFQDMMNYLTDIFGYHKVNVIIIAHVVGQRKADESNKLTHHSRVIITGGDKISGKIASYMHEVYHFDVKPNLNADAEGQYRLYTVHTGNDYARTSLPLEREIVFNNQPIYPTYIKPAIDKMNRESPVYNKIIQSPVTSNPIITSAQPNPFLVK